VNSKRQKAAEKGLAERVSLVPPLPFVFLVQRGGNVEVHELSAAHERVANGHLDAPYRSIEGAWFEAGPAPRPVADEFLDGVMHRYFPPERGLSSLTLTRN
jgi:hypothetical protein